MDKKIRVGIIGVSPERGWASIAHIPALRALPEYELRALSNRNVEKALAGSLLYEVPLVFHDNLDLIRHPEIDLVVITVKVPEHRQLVSEAIKAGKNVYCEWPLGNGLAETSELTALADARGVHTTIGLQSRAVPAIRYVKDLIAAGYVGEVLSTTLTGSGIIYGAVTEQAMAYAMDINNGAGMIYATMGHAADVLCNCLGEFSVLNATAVNRRKTTTIAESGEAISMTAFDQVAVNGVLENGAVAAFHYRGGMFKGTNFRWEINGTAGELLITADGGHPAVFPLTVQGSQDNDPRMELLTIPDKYGQVAATGLMPLALNVAEYYRQLARDLTTGTDLTAGFGDALVRHRMINAIEVAARTGIQQVL
jgi:predicted dehydrogenase